jgi:putative tricarboxylic transport membrane protein
VGAISGKSLVKGLISCCLGMIFAMVGISTITGTARFTFGITELTGGFTFVPMIIGLLVMPEVLYTIKNKNRVQKEIRYHASENPLNNKLTLKEYFSVLKTILKSTAIGTMIGSLPGLGSSTASFISYGEAKRVSKKPELFGRGSIEGIAASEASNNAVCGATMIPMLTLGIPGDDVTAILMGAFLIQGLTPGPTIFYEHALVIYGIYGGLLMCNLFVYVLAKSGFKLWIRLANIPKHYIFACVTAFSITGAFTINQSLFDIFILIFFMVFGYCIKVLGFNPAAFVVGFILLPFLEENLSQSLTLTSGNVLLFFTKPFAWVFMLLSVISIWGMNKQKKKLAKALQK